MSQRWDQVEERLDEYESQLDAVYRLYHIPVIAALMVFMLWVRVRHIDRHVGPDGEPLYRGNDPYYHYRTTNYVVQNYPFNMPFDPWTGFDTGWRAGQFGTILDQIVGTVALVVGLGSPSQETIVMTTLLAGPIVAVLCAIPLYVIGARLGGKFGGIIAVLILALTPGQFLSRSVAGYYGHHVTEVLFTLIALVVGMKMLTVAQREKPIYEFVQTREYDLLRRPALWGAAFGAAIALAILNWPPAVFLFGVFAVFLFVHLSIEFARGVSPDHVVIPSVVAMVVAALLTLPFTAAFELSVTDYTPLQPALALAVAVGAIFMAGVARYWERTDYSPAAYPAAVSAAGLAIVALVALLLPDVFEFLVRQVERVAGLGATDTRATIGEARAPQNPGRFFFSNYGLGFYTALGGLALMAYRVVAEERPRGEYLLVLVFSLFMLVFTLTQVRFDYYMVIGVAAGNAYLVGWIYTYVDLDDVRRDVSNIEPYQVLVVAAILFVIAGPLVVTGATVVSADANSQPGEIEQWKGSLDWLSENTPEPGAYGSGDDPRLEYYGSYENTDDFEYEDGEYGVLAWWDYGHFITARGERIPVANPFQQHATESADFLLADDEDEALEILDEDNGEGAGVQYVMVDYQLGFAGTSKYGAPAAFESRHDVDQQDLSVTVINPRTGRPAFGVHNQRAYESMRVRLYQHHGSAAEPASFVTRFGQYDPDAGYATPPEDGDPIEGYDSPEEAREAAEQDPNVVQGGVMGQPSERVEALSHFRLVHASENTAPSPFLLSLQQFQRQESWVKTFERVDGATVEGTGPPNAEVEAIVEMEVGSTGETFRYRQFAETDDEGNFEMVVPYSTTGYDEYGTDEGYTDVDVRANGSYEFAAYDDGELIEWTGEADVTEGQVLGEDDSAVEVELEEGEPPEGAQEDEEADEIADEEGSQDGGETDDGETDDNQTQDDGETPDDDQTQDDGETDQDQTQTDQDQTQTDQDQTQTDQETEEAGTQERRSARSP